jgi:hypothetical protein
MQTKPIFIGFAAGILILIVAAASFSAGLYLGQRGYVADLQYQSPQNVQGGPPFGGMPGGNSPQSGAFDGAQGRPQTGQAPQRGVGPVPGGGPPGAPFWPPDVLGRIISLTATAITLDTPQGQVTVKVSASTKVINELGNTLTTADLKTGDVIAVFGRDAAMTLMRLPPRPNAP